MRKLAFLFVAFTLVAVSFYGCDETNLTEPSAAATGDPAASVVEEVPSQAPLLSSQGGKAVLPFWTTGGNGNTQAASHFLGTLDNQPLILKTNGTEALRVTTAGLIGIGTTSPEGGLHIGFAGSFNTPQLTVEQSGGDSWNRLRSRNPGTNVFWDISTSPGAGQLRIFSSTPAQDVLTVSSSGSGRVGIGTTSPQAPLHVASGATPEVIVEETRAGGAVQVDLKNPVRTWTLLSDSDPDHFRIVDAVSHRKPITILGSNGYIGLGALDPNYPLEMGSGAHVTVGGVWTDASSRAYKENIRELTTAEAQTALNGLTPVQFNYKADRDEGYVGFIAEDVPELVATQDRDGLSPMDIVAVLTKVVQQQEKKIIELEARLDALQ